MRIGIYSGSFNPVHLGHVALADHLVACGIVDEVWLVRSPLNPLKHADGLMPDDVRLRLLQLAVEGHPGLRVSTVEDDLPRPNYSVNTLCRLRDEFPQHEFSLIIGADNWLIFDRWKSWRTIVDEFHVIVYPRPGYECPVVGRDEFPNVVVVADAPQFDVSSTQIRQLLASGSSLAGLVDPRVASALGGIVPTD